MGKADGAPGLGDLLSARTGFSDMNIATGSKTTTVMSVFMDVTALISIALVGPILGV